MGLRTARFKESLSAGHHVAPGKLRLKVIGAIEIVSKNSHNATTARPTIINVRTVETVFEGRLILFLGIFSILAISFKGRVGFCYPGGNDSR